MPFLKREGLQVQNNRMQTEGVKGKTLLITGIISSLIAAICCFTPLLVLAFAGAGLSGLVGGLDYFLFPLLFASLGLMTQALYLLSGKMGPSPKSIIIVLVAILSIFLFWLEFKYALRVSLLAVALVAIYALWLRRQKMRIGLAEGK